MNKKTMLICLPFAGGNKYSYRSLFHAGNPYFNTVSPEYPGRGARISEELRSDLNELSEDLYRQVSPILNTGEFAIYGHSLGGLLAYLLTLKIIQNKHRAPKHLFITGAAGPSAASRSERQLYLYPRKEFLEEVRMLGGLPEELLKEPEMISFLEPILRNDFKASATYIHEAREPLNVPVTVITGTEESITEHDILLWQKDCACAVDFITMPGDHFFIFKHGHELIDIFSKKLQHLEFSSYE
jgi:surfactin synthase thioesterase subunit